MAVAVPARMATLKSRRVIPAKNRKLKFPQDSGSRDEIFAAVTFSKYDNSRPFQILDSSGWELPSRRNPRGKFKDSFLNHLKDL